MSGMVVKLDADEVEMLRNYRRQVASFELHDCLKPASVRKVKPATIGELFGIEVTHEFGHPQWDTKTWNDCIELEQKCTVCNADSRYCPVRKLIVCTYHYNGCPGALRIIQK